jgi:hypothetical protein
MFFYFAGGGIFHRQNEIAVFPVFHHLTRYAPDILHALFPAANVEIFEALSESPDIHIEYLGFNPGIMVAQQKGILNRIHTADIAAIGIAPAILGTGADALYEADTLRLFLIAGPDEMAAGGSSGANQTFEFHAGYDVFIAGITVFVVFGGIVNVHAGGGDNDTHLDIYEFVLVIIIDAFFLADIGAFTAGDGIVAETVIHIENI